MSGILFFIFASCHPLSHGWRNKLKLNDDKTEFLVMTSKFHQQKDTDHTTIQVDSASIITSSFARNLGVMFDSSLSNRMEEQVKKICQSVFYHIRNVNSIRKTLSDVSAATIIHALITPILDNSNTLLYDVNNNLLTKPQHAQNAATTKKKKRKCTTTSHRSWSSCTGRLLVGESFLRGYCTSYQKLACFVLYLKIINQFLKNRLCIL